MIRYYQISHHTGVGRKDNVKTDHSNGIQADKQDSHNTPEVTQDTPGHARRRTQQFGKINIFFIVLLLAAVGVMAYNWPKQPSPEPKSVEDQVVNTNTSPATKTPETAAESGLEDSLNELDARLKQVELQRDLALRREAEKDKKLLLAASQLDRQNSKLARSIKVRRPTGTAGSERVVTEPDLTPERHATQILEYVWTTRDQVGSVSLLPGEAATVRIMGGVRFIVDPDPGLDITVILDNGTQVAFSEWQKKTPPVRGFEISNNTEGSKIALFVPQ